MCNWRQLSYGRATGSNRQVTFAVSIRLARLAALQRTTPSRVPTIVAVIDGRWWFYHRDMNPAKMPAPGLAA